MESEQKQALELAEELVTDIELNRSRVTQQVGKASRLARLIGDTSAQVWLRFEMRGVSNSEHGRYHMGETARWTNEDENKGHWGPVADFEKAIATREAQLSVSQTGALSGDHVLLAAREGRQTQAAIAGVIEQYYRIVNRVQAMVHEFASETYYALAIGSRQEHLFDQARSDVDALLTESGEELLSKIDAIYKRLGEGDAEAVSAAMNSCRRLIDGFADSVFPAAGSVRRGDQTIDLGQDKTLNRINEFVGKHCSSDSRRTRIRRCLKDLYDRTSTGVHTDVTAHEARYVFLMTYTLLGEIVTLEG